MLSYNSFQNIRDLKTIFKTETDVPTFKKFRDNLKNIESYAK